MGASIIPVGLSDLLLEYTELDPRGLHWINDFQELRQFANDHGFLMEDFRRLTRSEIEAIRDFEMGATFLSTNAMKKLHRKPLSFLQLNSAERSELRKKFNLIGKDEKIEITDKMLLEIHSSRRFINMIGGFIRAKIPVRACSKTCNDIAGSTIPAGLYTLLLDYTGRKSSGSNRMDGLSELKKFASANGLSLEGLASLTRSQIEAIRDFEMGPPLVPYHLQEKIRNKEVLFSQLSSAKKRSIRQKFHLTTKDEAIEITENMLLKIYPSLGLINMISSFVDKNSVPEETNGSELSKSMSSDVEPVCNTQEVQVFESDCTVAPTADVVPSSAPSLEKRGDTNETRHPVDSRNSAMIGSHLEMPLLDTGNALSTVGSEKNRARACWKRFDGMKDGIVPSSLPKLLLEFTECKPSDSNRIDSFSELKQFSSATSLSMEELASLTRSQIEAIRDFEISPPLVPYHFLEKLGSKEVSFSQLSRQMKCSLREKLDLTGQDESIEITENMLFKIYPSLGLINMISSFVDKNSVPEETNGSELTKPKSSDVDPVCNTQEVQVFESDSTIAPTVDFVPSLPPTLEKKGNTNETRHSVDSRNSAMIASHLEVPSCDKDKTVSFEKNSACSKTSYEMKDSKIPDGLHTLLLEYTGRIPSESNRMEGFSELKEFASANGLSMEGLASLNRSQIEAIRNFEFGPPLVPYHLMEKLRKKEVSFRQLSRQMKRSLRENFDLTGEDRTIVITDDMLLKIYPSLRLINMISSLVNENHVREETIGSQIIKSKSSDTVPHCSRSMKGSSRSSRRSRSPIAIKSSLRKPRSRDRSLRSSRISRSPNLIRSRSRHLSPRLSRRNRSYCRSPQSSRRRRSSKRSPHSTMGSRARNRSPISRLRSQSRHRSSISRRPSPSRDRSPISRRLSPSRHRSPISRRRVRSRIRSPQFSRWSRALHRNPLSFNRNCSTCFHRDSKVATRETGCSYQCVQSQILLKSLMESFSRQLISYTSAVEFPSLLPPSITQPLPYYSNYGSQVSISSSDCIPNTDSPMPSATDTAFQYGHIGVSSQPNINYNQYNSNIIDVCELLNSRRNQLIISSIGDSSGAPASDPSIVDCHKNSSGTPASDPSIVDYHGSSSGTPASDASIVDCHENSSGTPASDPSIVDCQGNDSNKIKQKDSIKKVARREKRCQMKGNSKNVGNIKEDTTNSKKKGMMLLRNSKCSKAKIVLKKTEKASQRR